jgi:hypothetical protein
MIKYSSKKELKKIIAPKWNNYELNTTEKQTNFRLNLNPSLSRRKFLKIVQELRDKNLIFKHKNPTEHQLRSEKMTKKVENEWKNNGLRTSKEKENFGNKQKPPVGSFTISNHLKKLEKQGKITYIRETKPFTKDEDKILKTRHMDNTVKELKKEYLPNRSKTGINNRLKKLKIKPKKDEVFWSEKENKIIDKIIEDNEKSVLEICKLLPNRSPESIYGKLSKEYNYYIQRIDPNDLKVLPWTREEVKILEKWFPILGVGYNRGKEIIGTPNLLDLLPNRGVIQIENKVRRSNIKSNHQIGVENGYIRCILCLSIKEESKFRKTTVQFYVCKNCRKIISDDRMNNRTEPERLGANLLNRFSYIDGINYDMCIQVVKKLIERDGYLCYFKDDFCGDRHVTGLTVGHKHSISQGGDPLNLKNLFLLCMEHNTTMFDIDFKYLKIALKSLSKNIENVFSKK